MNTTIKFKFNDGGRSKYFAAGSVNDCVVRAAAIASGRDYKEVYDLARKISGSTPRNGMKAKHARQLHEALGGIWHPCMGIGTGCTMHLSPDELPSGRIVCSVSKHYVAVIDGVINDTYDCSRDGQRCVYGYFQYN